MILSEPEGGSTLTIEELKQIKVQRGYSNARISELSGVPETTIQKIFSGTTSNPRYDTLRALEKALRTERSGSTYDKPAAAGANSGMILRDAQTAYQAFPAYDRQGTYTIEDREMLPEDRRTELIDGVLYDMASPTAFHQSVAGEVYAQLLQFIKERGGACRPFVGPVDVQLDRDEKTMIVPDVVVVCNPDVTIERWIYGVPDFVLEVISPSTQRKDYLTKLAKYDSAGVREYWIVDPYKHVILVYFFEDESKSPIIYGIDQKVPVNIYQGELEIDLQYILKWLP